VRPIGALGIELTADTRLPDRLPENLLGTGPLSILFVAGTLPGGVQCLAHLCMGLGRCGHFRFEAHVPTEQLGTMGSGKRRCDGDPGLAERVAEVQESLPVGHWRLLR